MKTFHDLKNIFVGGILALTMVAVVACSGTTTLTETNVASSTEPIANVAAGTKTSDIPSFDQANDIVVTAEVDSQTAESISIQAAFGGDVDNESTGDAVPEVAATPVEVAQLTPAEIVAAQENHLADLYEETVESVVFIVSTTTQGVGSGSGFVWDEEGHIVTNYHVVQGSTSLNVKFFNGREYHAKVVAFDPAADIAVIQLIDLEHVLVPIEIGSSSGLRPGQMAIALGNPFGKEFTMTTGIVSAVTRTLEGGFSTFSIPAVIQTDASINPGNSGGPLLDMNGAVIGINTQIESTSRQSSGVGFAVPVDLVKRVVPSLIEFGEHTYAFMGISGNEVNLSLRENAGLPGDIVGAYISGIVPDGPADLAGIRGDTGTQITGLIFDGVVIVSINSIRMKSMDDLIGYLALNTSPSEDIVVGVFRDGVEIAIPMTLGARPSVS